MEHLCLALSKYRRGRFKEAADLCTEILRRTPQDEAAWVLKMQCLTKEVYTDDLEMDFSENIASNLLDENAVATLPRPGTSLRQVQDGEVPGSADRAVRPVSASGRPQSGFARSAAAAQSSSSLEGAIRQPRTAMTARPVSASSGRFVRLGTASMLGGSDGQFINVARLNLSKYAQKPQTAKALFEYLLYKENDVRHALELAALATQHVDYSDWYWKLAVAKCYIRLGLYREAEKQLQSAIKMEEAGAGANPDLYEYLGLVYLRMDQPANALEAYRRGLEKHPNSTRLLLACARVHEVLDPLDRRDDASQTQQLRGMLNEQPALANSSANQSAPQQQQAAEGQANSGAQAEQKAGPQFSAIAALVNSSSFELYKRALRTDNLCPEALASLATNYFYQDQPEVALKFYRRLLEIGYHDSAALYCNVAVCCFYAQQYDVSVKCFDRAIELARDDATLAEIWYNVGLVCSNIGDLNLAYQCFRLVLSLNNNHGEAYNNLGVLEMHRGNTEMARSFFQASIISSAQLYEPHFNSALLSERVGDLQSSYQMANRTSQLYSNHTNTKLLLERLRQHFEAL